MQAEFESGVAMLHSYWFNYAGKTFKSVLEKDPNCAMAYWGVALDLLGNSLAGPPASKDAQAAWAALEKARAIGAKTQRERDWIEAISSDFRDHDKVPVNVRPRRLQQSDGANHATLPRRLRSEGFLRADAAGVRVEVRRECTRPRSNPRKCWKSSTSRTPHPGVSHFLIHAYDYPPLADKGIAAARRYAGIAPAVPHARHMPSHIYSMVGLWEESIASNMGSLEIQPDYYHAYDFAVYAALQLAQDARAKAMAEKAANTPVRGDRPPGAGNFTALAAMPARQMIERGDWAGAAALPVTTSPYPQADSLTRFTRGIGMARSGDAAGAKREIEAMETLRRALQKADQSFWADRTEEQMLAVAAWVAFAEGNKAQAEKLMRTAADSEDGSVKNVIMENRLYPLRELLADLLLEMGMAAPALREYEVALRSTSNRYRGIYCARCGRCRRRPAQSRRLLRQTPCTVEKR